MVSVQTLTVISNEHLQVWVPATKEVGGLNYMQLRKWDGLFTKFCTGRGLCFHRGRQNSASLPFYENMQKLRTRATQSAIEASLYADLDEDDQGQKGRRPRRAAKQSDRVLIGDVLTIMVADPHGVEQAVRVLFGIKNNDVWMEVTLANLTLINDLAKMDMEDVANSRDAVRHSRKKRRGQDAADDVEDEQPDHDEEEQQDGAEPVEDEQSDQDEEEQQDGDEEDEEDE
jgi:hypothetical protein